MAQDQVITFDFHNTIAQAEQWFEIEVRDLPGAFLRWQANQAGVVADLEQIRIANATYRELRGAIHHHGHELATEACISIVLHRIGVTESAAVIEEGSAAIMRESLAGIAPIPGVIETIEFLAAQGIALGIVSSAVHHDFLDWTLAEFGIEQHFSTVITSASAGFYKTRPEIYWHAVKGLGVSPDQAFHIGDSFQFDVLGARRAGIRSGWYQRPGAKAPDGETHPELVISTFEGAAHLLLEQISV